MAKPSLIAGDIHCKHNVYTLYIQEFKTGKYDKLIFLGDYVDDWSATPQDSLKTLEALVELKKKYLDRVILLLGNHDFSEWLSKDFRCAGFNPITHFIIKDLINENQDLFQVAYSDGERLYTHAGLTQEFINELTKESTFLEEYSPKNPDEWANFLNWIYFNREDDEEANKLFKMFNYPGKVRINSNKPASLIWADLIELIEDSAPISQVVGHTPVSKIKKYKSIKNEKETYLYFCDTHSTYRNGENIGNNESLIIGEKDEYRTIQLTN